LTTLAELRELAERLPVGASVVLSRDMLLEALGAPNAPALASTSPEFLTVAQLGSLLRRSPSTVRGWCEAHRFAGAFKLNGRDWKIPREALDGFLAGQRPEFSREDPPRRAIAAPGDTRVRPRRAQVGETPDLAAWRRVRPKGANS